MTFWCGYWVHLFKGLVHYFLWKPWCTRMFRASKFLHEHGNQICKRR
jgi:hypothetical protein